jgi:DNA-directed RNA polymerase subunit K/omega
MIYPSIADLSDEGVNRYILSIATAKCARKITDQQAAQAADANREEKSQGYSSKKNSGNEKPVKEAIGKLYTREYKIVLPEEN